jgi:hypothetical protein
LLLFSLVKQNKEAAASEASAHSFDADSFWFSWTRANATALNRGFA